MIFSSYSPRKSWTENPSGVKWRARLRRIPVTRLWNQHWQERSSSGNILNNWKRLVKCENKTENNGSVFFSVFQGSNPSFIHLLANEGKSFGQKQLQTLLLRPWDLKWARFVCCCCFFCCCCFLFFFFACGWSTVGQMTWCKWRRTKLWASEVYFACLTWLYGLFVRTLIQYHLQMDMPAAGNPP